MAPDGNLSQQDLADITQTLTHYAHTLRPWAKAVARFMLADMARRNEKAWRTLSQDMGRALLVEIQQAPTGMLFSALMDSQVELITSLPLGAAQRVHDLVVNRGLIGSERSTTLAKDILASGQVTASRARLIARTEVSRAQCNLTQARAMFAGSEGYIWRTSRDADVRETHKEQEGKYIRWTHPPKTDKNLDPYHAGCGPNCRCYPEPIVPVFK
jgi:SPP1 gp7 family putative phage head morphogenesis protein